MSEMADVSAGRAQQAGQKTKQEASATAGQAKQAAGEAVGTAAEQAKAVTGEAREQVGAAARDLRGRVTEQVETQARRGAGALRQWADDLAGLAEKAGGDSPAKDLLAQAADRGHRAADYLEKQGVGGLVEDLQNFARRRPGAFLGGAVLAGFAIGRLAKAGAKANGSSSGPSAQEPEPAQPAADLQGPPEDAVQPELAVQREV